MAKFARKALGITALFIGLIVCMWGALSFVSEDAATTCSNSPDYLQCNRPSSNPTMWLALGEIVLGVTVIAAGGAIFEK